MFRKKDDSIDDSNKGFFRKKQAWEKLVNADPEDTPKYRDVYGDQQLERSEIEPAHKDWIAVAAGIGAAILAFLLAWCILSPIFSVMGAMTPSETQTTSSSTTESSSTTTTSGTSLEYLDYYNYDEGTYEYAIRVVSGGNRVMDPSTGANHLIPFWVASNLGYGRFQQLQSLGGSIGIGTEYANYMDVPKTDWYIEQEQIVLAHDGSLPVVNYGPISAGTTSSTSGKTGNIIIDGVTATDAGLYDFNLLKLLLCLLFALVAYFAAYKAVQRAVAVENTLRDTTDINQYKGDRHIMLPEEVQRKYDWFPDVGAHSNVKVTSMVSHMALTNKGIKRVPVAKRYKEDVVDEDGDVIYYKGEIIYDENDEPVVEMKPLFDEEFADALFDASGAPKGKNDEMYRRKYDTTKIPYNPGNKNFDKLKGYDRVCDLINNDWELPLYEPQRPAGAYLVDTAPINTMVLAITRAGKGQTVIEPTIDMWLREKQPSNIVVNDPKGELLVKNYVRATVRGFQVVQFNLINVIKTDIYNPLALAADAAREGDFTKCASYVENIAAVFFPEDGAQDPVWPNAANNAFKRAAYGLIDYFLEEEKQMRRDAIVKNWDQKTLETNIDALWAKVTLYNCYQFFVKLSSQKAPCPDVNNADFMTAAINEENMRRRSMNNEDMDEQEVEEFKNRLIKHAELWEGNAELDLLTLYFNATARLPRNELRGMIDNADRSLRSMGAAEKMLASVYGIAITAMSFFTDPTISTLTSGNLSQNTDLAGLSFPRRFGVRFHPAFIEAYHLIGQQVKWSSYYDADFKNKMDKTFEHTDMMSREGWARAYFEGIFEQDISYLKLEILNPSTNQLIKTFYFKFEKGYQTTLNGRSYVKDPILEEKIVRNGFLTELVYDGNKYVPGSAMFTSSHVIDAEECALGAQRSLDGEYAEHATRIKIPCVTQTSVRYAEKPRIVFLVTPPHLMKYAKLILILIKQLVDLNFDKSYMTKSSQKPLYGTRFMLDELGNLQSEGHGISGFETMLSIGLGLYLCPAHM